MFKKPDFGTAGSPDQQPNDRFDRAAGFSVGAHSWEEEEEKEEEDVQCFPRDYTL